MRGIEDADKRGWYREARRRERSLRLAGQLDLTDVCVVDARRRASEIELHGPEPLRIRLVCGDKNVERSRLCPRDLAGPAYSASSRATLADDA